MPQALDSKSGSHNFDQIGRYKVLELLGQGGMGKVYRAYDPRLEREVVVKLVSSDLINNDERRQRFRREVLAASHLRHPHIVTIYDVDLTHDPPYLVMELLNGGALRERLKQTTLNWQAVLKLLRPLGQALAYAHHKGIVHRDVKPTNVMFAKDEALFLSREEPHEILKLVDFGLAQWQSEAQLTAAGIIMGTPAYMSPEQARAEKVDGRTDIFALGLILFEAIAGHNPVDKGSSALTLAEIVSERQIDPSPLLDKAPPEVVSLIKRAVVKDREQRYPNCEALLADLEYCLSSSDVTSTMSSIPGPKQPDRQPVHNPKIRPGNEVYLSPEIEMVLQTMFTGFDQAVVEKEFGGGFSGSRVFQVRVRETSGKVHLPAVIKIAPVGLIHKEWQAYERWVKYNLPNTARLEMSPHFPVDSLWGGLHYSLVGGGAFTIQSLHDYYWSATIDDLCWVLEERLFEMMGPYWWLNSRVDYTFQMQTDYDVLLPVNLLIELTRPSSEAAFLIVDANGQLPPANPKAGDRLQFKGFIITRIDLRRQQLILNLPAALKERPSASYQIRLRGITDMHLYRVGDVIESMEGEVVATRHDLLVKQAQEALGEMIDLAAERLAIGPIYPGSTPLSLPNPLRTYQKLLLDFITVKISTIHGDLNMENVLVDPATREVNLIDFATVHEGHSLRDLLRLEVELVINFIPPALVEAGLPAEAICHLYQQLHRVTTEYHQTTPHELPSPALEKPFKLLLVIRKMVRKCLFDLDDWQEYYAGLVLYLLGTLKFENLKTLPTAPLPQRVAFWAAAMAQSFLDASRSGPLWPSEKELVIPESVTDMEPYGTMRPNSKFYIERTVDKYCWEQIDAPYATTVFIQAPRQMGKSSLMHRMIEQARTARQKQSVFIDFQKFPEQYFSEEKDLYIELCLMIGEALDIAEAIDRYWSERRTNIMNCSRYLSDYLIPQFNKPFILAMDEVERMLTSPFRANFFGMLRTWHNDRVYNENFAKLSLFLSSSTEPYLFIDHPNQSPFNVAEVFTLLDFTRTEVAELNRRHHAPLTESQVDDLIDLVNGHPFLIRLALYLLATGKVADFQTILTKATDDAGPFGDHLHHYLLRVLQRPELKEALIFICRHESYEENQIFYRLKGAGLIKREGKRVVFRNKLYDRYFKERLNVEK